MKNRLAGCWRDAAGLFSFFLPLTPSKEKISQNYAHLDFSLTWNAFFFYEGMNKIVARARFAASVTFFMDFGAFFGGGRSRYNFPSKSFGVISMPFMQGFSIPNLSNSRLSKAERSFYFQYISNICGDGQEALATGWQIVVV